MLCTNRPEGFGPKSHLYSHILTSCFLDTILVPLCTWLYLATLLILLAIPIRAVSRPLAAKGSGLFSRRKTRDRAAQKWAADHPEYDEATPYSGPRTHTKTKLVLRILYFLLIIAQILMCVLEITRLSLAKLGIGLLPFTFVTLIVAGTMHGTKGMAGRVVGWRWANLAVWVALAVTNGVKVAEEAKEGYGAMARDSKYKVVDELTDVSVMIGVYAALFILEAVL